MSLKDKIERTTLPKHIAIIMDGNGRWAQKQGKDRYWGHQEGVISVRKIVEAAVEVGIKYITLYTFSTENWQRPQEEVNALMELMITAVRRETPDLMKNNVRIRMIGDISRLPQATKDNLQDCLDETSRNTGLTLVLALSYSSRWEITEAVKQIASKVRKGDLEIDQIDENVVADYLNTRNIPDPDLLIRTGGEYRISNFLMWQLSYAELYFTDVYWPEFREENLYKAILDFQNRERRFGKTGEQVQSEIIKQYK
ncbi:isoprenyl transferase [Bacteroidia bacterium]|nr:isoprenyl transferase [Bacteroidia bacterium]GHV20545.1 isoprenyl transferase [Bacteroidia bacterium]